MKKMKLSLIAICLLFCITACQPTPQSPAVQRKDPKKLERAIESSNAQPGEYEAPETFSFALDGLSEGVEIFAKDAEVVLPEQEAFPVYTVEPARYTQE